MDAGHHLRPADPGPGRAPPGARASRQRTSTPPRQPRCSWSPAGAASRAELFQAFERAGQSTAGQRGIHLLGILCQRGLLVQGPLAGNQQLVVAFDDWITESRTLDRADGIAEWLLRYLRSHGPATERDFCLVVRHSADGNPGGPGPGVGPAGGAGVRGDQLLALRRRQPRCSTTASPGSARCWRCRGSMNSCSATRTGPSCCRRSTPTRSSPAATACSRRPSWPAAA